MRQCLTSPDGGYYTSPSSSASDQFGAKGDFVTSPEISQIFGELVGIWFMTEWMGQGRPKSGVQFIELGPGRGTLMSDILRTISQFKAFSGAVNEVWLVEAGESLRQKQKDTLCGSSAQIVEKNEDNRKWWECSSIYPNTTVKWVEDIVLMPPSTTPTTPFIIAHEFFDALPIHAFESVAPAPTPQQQPLSTSDAPTPRPSSASQKPQWRELLVTPTPRALPLPGTPPPISSTPQPDFQLTLAKASNPSSLVLTSSPRYKALQSQPGSRTEVSPDSARYIGAISELIGPKPIPAQQSSQTSPAKASGAALIIDYGPLSTIPINSLRGISQHKIVSPFVTPGQADLSSDVDFTALADHALTASENVEVHGPVEQGNWLEQLGIRDRADRLMKTLMKSADWAGENEVRKKEFESGWRRLVEGGPKGMGKAYKVMAIVPEGGGKRRPVGFGGGVIG